jgi:AMMECR1 domain-containing protein
MPRVEPEELAGLSIEVSVLGAPELVQGVSELDPELFGVIVSQGTRRGVLLPRVTGIDDAAEQVRVALRKAGISESESYCLERFTVKKAMLVRLVS